MKFIEEESNIKSITGTFSTIGKFASYEQLINFGKKILILHKPIKIDWLSYFGIKKGQKKNISVPDAKRHFRKRSNLLLESQKFIRREGLLL
ncbi:hypothetical protein [Desulfurobacterium indicum]|uniref:Uncharacterized protein n=1 Tax=Desulfurobacterium indicum TaxID=1914305 RepID=A0A1R1MK50_9BACT|nr:hypothetical protein [Desulfurobacterium indicum]OMH40080.1 hypothetical protein BLW93_07095 [Desulfurobacterium indicum]